MPKFTFAPLSDVMPKKRIHRGPSQRAQTQELYRDAVRNWLEYESAEGFVIELEPSDKALTVRNNIQRALEYLRNEEGLSVPVRIRRHGNTVFAYVMSAQEVEAEQAKPPRKARAKAASSHKAKAKAKRQSAA